MSEEQLLLAMSVEILEFLEEKLEGVEDKDKLNWILRNNLQYVRESLNTVLSQSDF